MALLVEQIQWSDEPLLPPTSDPSWEAEVTSVVGAVPICARMAAPSPWIRRAYLDALRVPTRELSESQVILASLVTSQENACRYCYGVARAQMRMLGFSERVVEEVEGRAQLAEATPGDREALRFCRNLARSKPRPSRQAMQELEQAGFSHDQVLEFAYVVAAVGFSNRLATLLAVPPESGLERHAAKSATLWQKLTSFLPGRGPSLRLPPPDYPPPKGGGEFGALVSVLGTLPAAAVLEVTLHNAFASTVLPRRTKLLMFAVVARTLDCVVCEGLATQHLQSEQVSRDVVGEVLGTLGSNDLSEIERLLIPWTRETVWMPEEPKRIQEHTRPLLQQIGAERVLDAIGIAALANSCVRLAMLLQ